MTIEEMKARIDELEAERDQLRAKIKRVDVQPVPIESVVRHPWLESVFGGDAKNGHTIMTNFSAALRHILFGRLSGRTYESYRLVDPVTNKQYRWSAYRGKKEEDEIRSRLVERKVLINEKCAVKFRDMTSDEWERYRAAFEKVACALDEFVSEGWREE